MAEGVNVRFGGELQRFLHSRIGDAGLYGSASEYIRDLVRRDYERDEERKWALLRHALKPGLEAGEDEFVKLDADKVLAEAKAKRKNRGS